MAVRGGNYYPYFTGGKTEAQNGQETCQVTWVASGAGVRIQAAGLGARALNHVSCHLLRQTESP